MSDATVKINKLTFDKKYALANWLKPFHEVAIQEKSHYTYEEYAQFATGALGFTVTKASIASMFSSLKLEPVHFRPARSPKQDLVAAYVELSDKVKALEIRLSDLESRLSATANRNRQY